MLANGSNHSNSHQSLNHENNVDPLSRNNRGTFVESKNSDFIADAFGKSIVVSTSPEGPVS